MAAGSAPKNGLVWEDAGIYKFLVHITGSELFMYWLHGKYSWCSSNLNSFMDKILILPT